MRDIDLYTKEYDELPFEAIQVEFRRKKVLEQINKYSHDRVLEVGCGLEPLFAFWDDFSEMTIVEPSSEFVENARQLISKGNYFNIEVVQGFLEEAYKNISEKPYDLIVVSSLLHELEKPQDILNVVRQLCTDNTVVHINVPNAESLHRYLALEMGLIDSVYEKSDQQKRLNQHATFDIVSLCRLVEDNGFTVIEKGSYFPKLFTHGQMQKLVDMGIVNGAMLDGMYRMSKYLDKYGSEIYVDLIKKDK